MDLAELSDMRSSLTSVRVARPGSGAGPVWTGGLLLRDGQVFSFGAYGPSAACWSRYGRQWARGAR